MAALALTDIVVPERFGPYVQLLTEVKSRLIQSGALARSAALDEMLAGGGNTFNVPSWNDVPDDADRIATIEDVPDTGTTVDLNFHSKITSNQEIQARLSRNQSWKTNDLSAALAGSDPAESIAQRVSDYWRRRQQTAFIATMSGVNKDNGVNDAGDYVNSIVGGGFVDGVTNFSAEAFIDAAATMGDSSEDLSLVMVHSTVYSRMKKNNLIDFIPDARGEVNIPTFLGHEVIVDDNMPNGTASVLDTGLAGSAGMFETWLFGPGAVELGVGSPKVPVEVERSPNVGNGSGGEVLYNRLEWILHPAGHAYTGTVPDGGPSNAATTNNLNIATSWDRVFGERKQIKFARLLTRES